MCEYFCCRMLVSDVVVIWLGNIVGMLGVINFQSPLEVMSFGEDVVVQEDVNQMISGLLFASWVKLEKVGFGYETLWPDISWEDECVFIAVFKDSGGYIDVGGNCPKYDSSIKSLFIVAVGWLVLCSIKGVYVIPLFVK